MTTTALTPYVCQLPVPVGSFETYVQAVHAIPLLTQDEEQTLARRLRTDDDVEAARGLILAHLRFVVQVARGYLGYGLPLADLVQEGNIGLMKAVRRFDPEHGVRLVSFAVHWIRAEIHEFILRNWRIVRVATTKAQRKLFFNLRSVKKQLGWLNREDAAVIARDMGVDIDTVHDMELRLGGQDIAFDPLPENDRDDDGMLAPAAWIEDPTANPALACEDGDWREVAADRLAEALERLDARSRDIIARRWMQDHKATLHELAAEYGVSAERIRQIEANAMKKLRLALPTP